ncbi:hypothetical protein Bca101_068110 [Brassica carinata]
MVRCVRFWRGQWKKSAEEEWEFMVHPEDIGYRAVVYETVSYDTVDQIIRQRYGLSRYTPVVISHRLPNWMLGPRGNRTPPTTIACTAVLTWLLHERTWVNEIPLFITMGPKDVADYEFHCRTNFAIGNTSYVFDHTASENSRAAYESLVFGNRAAQTERVMNALFPEDSLRLFHRVSMEMSFADNFLANQQRGLQPVREIIHLDDDDEVMGEEAQGTVGNGQGVTGPGTEVVVPNGQGDAPPVLWDVGMDITTVGEQQTAQPPPSEVVDDGMMFWARMASECLALGGDVGNASMNGDLGSIVGDRNEAADKEDPRLLIPSPVGLDESDGSRTDSSHADIGPLTQPTSNEVEAAQGLALATTKPVQGNNTKETDPKASDAVPPMMKLAMVCATKGEGSAKPRERSKETSSEGSSTEGGNRGSITPKVASILTRNFEIGGGYQVTLIAEDEYEVRDKNGKVSVDSLVLPAYTVGELRSAYAGSVLPVPDNSEVTVLAGDLGGMHLYPPTTRRPPGRPKKQRFLSRGEKIVSSSD